VGVGDEQLVDEILFLDARRRPAAPAAPLRLVVGHRLGLGIAAVRERDDDVLLADQVLQGQVEVIAQDLGATLVAVLVAHREQLVADHGRQPVGTLQDLSKIFNFVDYLFVFIDNFSLLEAGEPMQAKVEDGLRLGLGEVIAVAAQAELGAEPDRPRGLGAGALQQAGHDARRPGRAGESGARLRRRRRGLDQRDDLVDVGQRHRQALEDVGAFPRLAQLEDRAPRDDLAAVPEEGLEHFLEGQQLRLAVHQRDHVDAEHVCSGVCLNRLFSTTSPFSPRLSSMTTRKPSLSDSSRSSLMPSSFFSRTSSAIFSTSAPC
jgi:hypothetical protein